LDKEGDICGMARSFRKVEETEDMGPGILLFAAPGKKSVCFIEEKQPTTRMKFLYLLHFTTCHPP
jgi:hypothetical protein